MYLISVFIVLIKFKCRVELNCPNDIVQLINLAFLLIDHLLLLLSLTIYAKHRSVELLWYSFQGLYSLHFVLSWVQLSLPLCLRSGTTRLALRCLIYTFAWCRSALFIDAFAATVPRLLLSDSPSSPPAGGRAGCSSSYKSPPPLGE